MKQLMLFVAAATMLFAACSKDEDTTTATAAGDNQMVYNGKTYQGESMANVNDNNAMLECYSEYFMEAYGYNKSLGSSLAALDYKDYDYAEAVDVFDDALNKISSYVRQVEQTEIQNGSSTNSNRFRSSDTGYTFPDLLRLGSVYIHNGPQQFLKENIISHIFIL